MIYLDNNSTTQPDHNMLNAAQEVVLNTFGNPSTPHEAGMDAKDVLEDARGKVAKAINARSSEIVFTSGGTESNNLAASSWGSRWCSSVEHPSVYNACHHHEGMELLVNKDGTLGSLDYFEDRLKEDPYVFVSAMWVNNETGVILDPEKKLWALKEKYPFVLHVDAVQALGKLPIDVENSPIDMLSVSAHKIHGLKGVGALYISRKLETLPSALMQGGKHERGFRPGTENQIGIYSFGYMANKITRDEFYKKRIASIKSKRDRFEELLKNVSEINGSPEHRVGNVSNLYFPSLRGRQHTEGFLDQLSEKRIYASRGSACSIGDQPSRVLQAMYGNEGFRGNKSVRFSLSVNTTESDIEQSAEAIKELLHNGE